jgi:hypothetical protein
MDSTPPSKDTLFQDALKRNIWLSVLYKIHTLLTEMNPALGWKAERFTNLMVPQNRQK